MSHNTAATLNIHMFGDFRLTFNGMLLPVFPTREAELLFGYLLLHRERFFHRDALIENFFKGQSVAVARKRLRNDIWRIRSVLEPDGVPAGTFLTVTNREIGFNTASVYRLDSEEFEQCISKTVAMKNMPLKTEDYLRLQGALELYRGDFLEGVYDDWCIWEKERLKMLYLRGLEVMMKHHSAKSEWQRAIVFGEQLVSHDPLRENIHRSLMRFYYLVGDRPTAILRYTDLTVLLRKELDIEPMQATTDLYRSIKNESLSAGEGQVAIKDSFVFDNEIKSVQECLGHIYLLANQLDDLSSKLKQQIQSAGSESGYIGLANK